MISVASTYVATPLIETSEMTRFTMINATIVEASATRSEHLLHAIARVVDRIVGHTDGKGSREYNLKLSQQREIGRAHV